MKVLTSLLRVVLLLASNTVWAACTVVVQPVLFGNYDVFDTVDLDSTGLVEVTCDSVADSYSIALSAGMGSYSQRKMMQGIYALNYNLYTNSGRTTVWGDGTAGTSVVNGGGLLTSFSLYGRVTAQQSARVGAYSDNLVLTLTF
ncbi:spore coat protein U domain-containing protein [Moraxellaceae bacterium AER2_44_116]|nr:spore coat protein U domain-containing protein [Moraxellaceae bacterium]TQC96117.1 spore coat protein U domain-containing protein [Moraxellaceae bacterium AER2_44_116]